MAANRERVNFVIVCFGLAVSVIDEDQQEVDIEMREKGRSNATPQLWILGGEDYEAPSAETSRRIKSLIADGRPFTLAIYPRAEHGMTLFEPAADNGERLSTRYVPGYFAMIRDYARDGRLHGAYGDAAVTNARDRAP